jgi:phosphopantetheine adenylyltransferase
VLHTNNLLADQLVFVSVRLVGGRFHLWDGHPMLLQITVALALHRAVNHVVEILSRRLARMRATFTVERMVEEIAAVYARLAGTRRAADTASLSAPG